MATGDTYTVHLVIRAEQVGGPDIEWEDLADVAKRNAEGSISTRQGASFEFRAEVDTPET
jgi:hypothetical protein